MKKTVLVLTNTEDGMHSDIVIQKLLECGEKIFRMDSDRLATGALRVCFTADSRQTRFVFEDDTGHVASDEVKSVWYRRPNCFNLAINDPIQKTYAELELISFLDGLWTLIPKDVFWLSKPQALEHARKKIRQLELARTMGLQIPRTIISNNPNDVRAFYKSCGGRIIFKAIYHEFLNYGKKAFNIPTTLVTPAHLAHLDLVRTLPAMFQECISKKYEIRITVVGKKVFPVKIDSQSNSLSVVDWRNPVCINDLKYSPMELPKEVSDICTEMLDKFGLSFGAFDFIMGLKNELYFLEVNPNGQWYWLEEKAGVLISDAIVDILR